MNITFTSARLESFTRTPKGGKAIFASSWNQKAATAMGWQELPDSVSGASLDGELSASSLSLTPSDSEMKRHAIDLDITQVHKFEAVRLEAEGKKGKGHRTEIRFHVIFADVAGCKKLEQYMQTIGAGKGTCTVSYTKQEELQLVTEEQAVATAATAD